MASPNTIDVGKDGWKAYITQRTKALPKNSLFGSILENVDQSAAADIDTKAYEQNSSAERQKKASQYTHRLPSRLESKTGKTI